MLAVVLSAFLLGGAAGCDTGFALTSRAAPMSAVAPPATPDPAGPDPSPPDPAAPPPAAAGSAPATEACTTVLEGLAHAVIRYEVESLAEDGPGGGDRAAVAADMSAELADARAAAAAVAGLAAVAAPVMTAVAQLRDGMPDRAELSAQDAGPWREARDRLQDWCRDRY